MKLHGFFFTSGKGGRVKVKSNYNYEQGKVFFGFIFPFTRLRKRKTDGKRESRQTVFQEHSLSTFHGQCAITAASICEGGN